MSDDAAAPSALSDDDREGGDALLLHARRLPTGRSSGRVDGDATHHYVWSNRDHRFWIDDRTAETRPDGRWAAVDLIVEDLRRGTFTADGKVELRRGAGWWRWNGLRWLRVNGFLADDVADDT